MHFQSIYQTINPVTTKIFFWSKTKKKKKSFKKCLCLCRSPVLCCSSSFSSASVAKKKRRRNLTGLVFLKHCDSCSFLKSLFITLFWKKGKNKSLKTTKTGGKKKIVSRHASFWEPPSAIPPSLLPSVITPLEKKEKKRVTNVFKCHLAVENVFHGDFSVCVLTICSIYWATVAVFVLCLLCALSSVGLGEGGVCDGRGLDQEEGAEQNWTSLLSVCGLVSLSSSLYRQS